MTSLENSIKPGLLNLLLMFLGGLMGITSQRRGQIQGSEKHILISRQSCVSGDTD